MRVLLLISVLVTALALTAAPASACHPESLENPEPNHHGCGGDGSKGGGDEDPGTDETDATAPVVTALRTAVSMYFSDTKCFTGVTGTLHLSEKATVTLVLTRRGRAVTTFVRDSPAGSSGSLSFPRVRSGRYVLAATAVDAAGNRSAERRRRVHIPRPRC